MPPPPISFLIFETDLFLNLKLFWLDWLKSKAPGASSTGDTDIHHCVSLLRWVVAILTQVSYAGTASSLSTETLRFFFYYAKKFSHERKEYIQKVHLSIFFVLSHFQWKQELTDLDRRQTSMRPWLPNGTRTLRPYGLSKWQCSAVWVRKLGLWACPQSLTTCHPWEALHTCWHTAGPQHACSLLVISSQPFPCCPECFSRVWCLHV